MYGPEQRNSRCDRPLPRYAATGTTKPTLASRVDQFLGSGHHTYDNGPLRGPRDGIGFTPRGSVNSLRSFIYGGKFLQQFVVYLHLIGRHPLAEYHRAIEMFGSGK